MARDDGKGEDAKERVLLFQARQQSRPQVLQQCIFPGKKKLLP
jgi:hypothetical protein